MCFVGVALKEGGGIFWFETLGKEGKIASFAKLAYINFVMYELSLWIFYYPDRIIPPPPLSLYPPLPSPLSLTSM